MTNYSWYNYSASKLICNGSLTITLTPGLGTHCPAVDITEAISGAIVLVLSLADAFHVLGVVQQLSSGLDNEVGRCKISKEI